jgi:hypothetical protein
VTPGARQVAWAAAAFALYAAARAAVAALYDWQPAFDDFWFLPETQRWLAAGKLGSDATFARVPLWHGVLALHMALFGSWALLVLQSWIVLGAIGAYALWLGPGARPLAWLPLLVFLLSPQVLLYSRQGVNELFIGLLAMAVMLVGERRGARGAPAMGALVGVAACTKPVAALLAVVALGYALRDRAGRAAALARFALGFAAVALPILAVAVVQRGSWLVDNTTAFNLSGMSLEEWRALPDAATRQQAGMAFWWHTFASAPGAYLLAASGRAIQWIVRPSSLDFALFYREYPVTVLAVADGVAFALLCALAVLGTRRADAFVWLLVAGLAFACAFPQFTPRSPKIVWMFPALLLSARGALRVSDTMARPRPERGSA